MNSINEKFGPGIQEAPLLPSDPSVLSTAQPMQAELIDEREGNIFSKAEKSNYLVFGTIVQHVFSFLSQVMESCFFSYHSKNSYEDEGQRLEKPIFDHHAFSIADATLKTKGVSAPLPPIADAVVEDASPKENILALYRGITPFAREESKSTLATKNKKESSPLPSKWDRYLNFCDGILSYKEQLSPATCEAAERLRTATKALQQLPPPRMTSKDARSLLWDSAKRTFFGSTPESAETPDLEADLGTETHKELLDLVKTAHEKNQGDLSSLDLSDKKFDPLFEKKYDALRAGLQIKLRTQDVIKLTDPLDQFNKNFELLALGLKKDLGIDRS